MRVASPWGAGLYYLELLPLKKMFFGAAFAATALIASPAAAEGSNISGGRFEALVGYDRVGFDLNDTFGIDDSLHMSGVLYGIGVGYDVPVSKTVSLGVDLEATDATTKRTETFIDATTTTNVSGRVSAGRDLYAGGRLTVAVSPKVNMYLKAGYTNARIKASAQGTLGGVAVDESASGNGDGVRAGAGAQFDVGHNTYLGVEYRYSNYESDFTRNQLAATFGVRF